MDLFLMEHGEVIKNIVTGLLVVTTLGICVAMLYKVLPEYDTTISADSSYMIEEIEKYKPRIESEDIIYADFGKVFDVINQVKITDYDGTKITDVEIKGKVNNIKKGLYTLVISVTGKKGHSESKKINVLVE